ncbi:MAG TPA: NAD-dependent epimerase/dehydratase family protein [Gallionella sp.]|nr:NAD-dependent epimerase/dehydratase family protein [Gallionella sp.]
MTPGLVAIVGGRGYLGCALKEYLVSRGIPCRIVGRQSMADVGSSSLLEYRSSSPSLEDAVSGASVVVHLASLTTPAIGARNPHLDTENVDFTLSLARACTKMQVGQLVFVSSGGTVYGEISSPAVEEQPVNPRCSYAIAKVACENYLRMSALETPLRVAVLRISNVYGGRQVRKGEQGVVSYLAEKIAGGQTVSLLGDTIRDYVYISDVVHALFMSMQHARQFEIFNISTGVGTSLVDLAQTMGALLGTEVQCLVGEPRPYDLSYNVLRNDKAKAVLGWEPEYDLVAGLRAYLGVSGNVE